MKTFNLILCTFMLLMFFSCKKDEKEETVPSYYLTDDQRQYGMFKKNTRWIYQNTITAEKDTVTVISSSSSVSPHTIGGSIAYHYELGEMNCISTIEGNFSEDFLCQIPFASIGPGIYTQIGGLGYLEILGLSKSNGFNTTVSSISTLNLAGTDYSNVRKVSMDNQKSPGTSIYYAAEFYWVKNIGVIKKVITENGTTETWNLIFKEIYQ